MKTQLLTYLIVFVIGAVLAYAITSKYGPEKTAIEVQQVHDLKDLERIKNLEKQVQQRDTLWVRIRKHDKARFDSLQTLSSKKRYHEPIKIDLSRFNDIRMDSIIGAITGL